MNNNEELKPINLETLKDQSTTIEQPKKKREDFGRPKKEFEKDVIKFNAIITSASRDYDLKINWATYKDLLSQFESYDNGIMVENSEVAKYNVSLRCEELDVQTKVMGITYKKFVKFFEKHNQTLVNNKLAGIDLHVRRMASIKKSEYQNSLHKND